MLISFFGYSQNHKCNKSHKFSINKSLHSDSIDVLHYTIDLKIVEFSTKTISGNTEIKLIPRENNVSKILLDLLQLTIDSMQLNNSNYTNYTYNDSVIEIVLPSAINPVDTNLLKIFYSGSPQLDPTGWGGFDFQSGVAYNLGVGFGEDPHNFGRAWFPCIDDFIDRATYDFHISVSPQHTAVCNGTLVSQQFNNDSTLQTFHWNLRDKIPTYLASVAVSNFVAVRDTFNLINGEIPSALYVRPSDSINAINSFINLGQALAGFEEDFGAYIWERVGYVSTPVGAMEHPTNVAFPTGCFNGSLSCENTMAHELSHHWFGDLISCATQEDMWINEGWASFCESIFKEYVYGYQAYKDYTRENHHNVLKKTHITDDGYRAIYGIPHAYTYGSTVYDKGANAVHSLRGYLGDDLFFDATKNFLQTYSFQPVTTEKYKNQLSSFTGIDMTGFFDAWILSPGFVHFSIDSFSVENAGTDFEVEVFVRQKLKHAPNFANFNRLEITFMDENWQIQTEILEFSGELGSQSFTIPFEPKIVLADAEEKLSDATTDEYKTIQNTGVHYFDNSTYFVLDVEQISDSAFLRVEHNWVSPDPLKIVDEAYTLSDFRYWKIDGILPANFLAKAKFSFDKRANQYMDFDLLDTANIDSLIILYRPNTATEWSEIAFERTGVSYYGDLVVDSLQVGEYTLALRYGAGLLSKPSINKDRAELKVYPNPSNNRFVFEFDIKEQGKIEISSIDGKRVFSKKVYQYQNSVNWNSNKFPEGIYIVSLKENNMKIAERKIVVQRWVN